MTAKNRQNRQKGPSPDKRAESLDVLTLESLMGALQCLTAQRRQARKGKTIPFIVWVVDANPANRRAALELAGQVNAALKAQHTPDHPGETHLSIEAFDSPDSLRLELERKANLNKGMPDLILTGLRFGYNPKAGLNVHELALANKIACLVVTESLARSANLVDVIPSPVLARPVLGQTAQGSKPYGQILDQFVQQLVAVQRERGPIFDRTLSVFRTWLGSARIGLRQLHVQVEQKVGSLKQHPVGEKKGQKPFTTSSHPPQASGSGAQGRRPARVPTRLPLVGAAP